jgi:hypothetical protein
MGAVQARASSGRGSSDRKDRYHERYESSSSHVITDERAAPRLGGQAHPFNRVKDSGRASTTHAFSAWHIGHRSGGAARKIP